LVRVLADDGGRRWHQIVWWLRVGARRRRNARTFAEAIDTANMAEQGAASKQRLSLGSLRVASWRTKNGAMEPRGCMSWRCYRISVRCDEAKA
jgi:hypothetical protein